MTEGNYDARRAALALAQRCKRYYERRYKVGRYGNSRSLRGCQGRKAARKAGKAYALAALLTLVLGFLPVSDALASDMNNVIYGPTAFVWDGTTYYEVGVVAANKYDAALVALNYDPADNDKFTSEVKAKLSNEGFGGAFWDFAQNFEAPPTDGGTVTQTGIQPGFWSTAYSLYGQGNVWYGKFGWVQKVQAYAAVEAVLEGGNLGGGSGGVTYEDLPDVLQTDTVIGKGYNNSDCATWTGTGSSALKNAYQTEIRQNISEYPHITVLVMQASGRSVSRSFRYSGIVMTKKKPTVNAAKGSGYELTILNVSDTGGYKAFLGGAVTDTNYQSNVLVGRQIQSKQSYGNSPLLTTFTGDGTFNVLTSFSNLSVFAVAYNNGNIGQPTIPETNWPEPGDPVPDPDPPEVPDVPDDDPIDQPDPVNPTPPQQPTDVVGGTPPQYDPIIYPVDSTFTVDIQGILDAMAEHCRHLQAALHTLGENLSDNITNAIFDNVSWLYDMVYQQFGWIGNIIKTEGQSLRSNIYGNVGYLGDTIVDEFDSLKTYLQSLFTWLGQQMSYTVNIDKDSYDDSSVLYWLKRIWAKLGAGDINTRPTDPVADPWDIGEWLRQLWANFTADLIAMGADLLADLAMDLRDLVTKFPFSIPWDIAALLAVLAAEPVAPEIVWPWFTVGTSGNIVSTNITISLDDYDDYLGGVRTMEKLLFVGYLLFRVKDDIALLFSGGLDA